VITVLADRHHYQLQRFLHPALRLVPYDPIAGWSGDQVHQADALLVRTTNPVNAATLPEGSRVRFVATASAGRDHLDEAWLDRLGITVADAKGSNARSVAEYVAVAVLAACDALDVAPSELTAGVIGAGFTGSATADLLGKLGVTCKLHDPPREEREQKAGRASGLHSDFATARDAGRTENAWQPSTGTPFKSASLEEVLECDILTLHVPLERSGPHATWHWLDEAKLSAAPKKLVINASRGGVMDEQALLTAHEQGLVRAYVCDVWEGEPVFSDATAKQAILATPHIAGYSIEAKRNASEMMCSAMHRFFRLENPEPPAVQPHPQVLPGGDRALRSIIGHLHPAFSYDADLRRLSGRPDADKGPAFLRLRQDTPLRHEFAEIGLDANVLQRHPILAALGFRTIESDTA
jgi:erythronate-4-phosphate dehydrogenase